MKRIDSDSRFQLDIEAKLVSELEKVIGVKTLHNKKKILIQSEPETYFCPDIYSEEHGILGEVHVHAGPIKSGQRQKIANDILKMLLFEKTQNKEYKKYYLICSDEEDRFLHGKSYVAAAAKIYGIQILKISLSEKEKNKLQAIMTRQDLSK